MGGDTVTFTPIDRVSVIYRINSHSAHGKKSVEVDKPISEGLFEHIPQIDGIVDHDFMFDFEDVSLPIPVHTTQRPISVTKEKRKRTLKTVRRIPHVNRCPSLPSVLVLNPRSLFGKEDDVGLVVKWGDVR